MTFLTSDFDFELPIDRIAQYPIRPRDAARLLCVSETIGLKDKLIHNLPDLLQKGDILVANDTEVIAAQLIAHRGQAKIGITLDRPTGDGNWHVLIKNSRRLRIGDQLDFSESDVFAQVIDLEVGGSGILHFSIEGPAFDLWLKRAGQLALPPYINRPNGPTKDDQTDYTTIFSQHPGAVAAPTAGLHFTPSLLAKLDKKGVERLTITLHVGAGTFLPVRSEHIEDHHMHAEYGHISIEVAERLNQARTEKRRIIAVGTTSLRLLESATDEKGIIQPFHQETNIFIQPGYPFKVVDSLITNFHLPKSTLFMLVCAFAGIEKMQQAYAHAIRQGYRFYSYGDACLLHR